VSGRSVSIACGVDERASRISCIEDRAQRNTLRDGLNHEFRGLTVMNPNQSLAAWAQVFTRAACWAWLVPLAPAVAQDPDSTTLFNGQGLVVRWQLQTGLNAVTERKVFWDLAETTAPGSGFDANKQWLELFIKPGLTIESKLDQGAVLYGKLSAVASYTWGTDAFDSRNTGAKTFEEAHLGLRGEVANAMSYDVTIGPRELRLGTGMLVASGASSGFERGALKFGPRKAWDRAVVASLEAGGASGIVFYLSPNELPSSEGGNELAGLDLRYDDSSGGYLGLTMLGVRNSSSPYVQAAANGVGAPIIMPGARQGTRALSFYSKTNPLPRAPNWTFTADFAYEWNDRIDLKAWAGRVQASYVFSGQPWVPSLSYSYQTFSGDNPSTAKLERFDPLYYEGNPNAWSTGSKSSMAFINSNVQAHSVSLRMKPTGRDSLTLRYSHIRANELRSPIQFGQATRIETDGAGANVVSGVTHRHLADDVFLEFNRVLNPNTFLSAGAAISFPGRGIKDVTWGAAPNWTGAYLNLVLNY
jgi:hypothetical protein